MSLVAGCCGGAEPQECDNRSASWTCHQTPQMDNVAQQHRQWACFVVSSWLVCRHSFSTHSTAHCSARSDLFLQLGSTKLYAAMVPSLGSCLLFLQDVRRDVCGVRSGGRTDGANIRAGGHSGRSGLANSSRDSILPTGQSRRCGWGYSSDARGPLISSQRSVKSEAGAITRPSHLSKNTANCGPAGKGRGGMDWTGVLCRQIAHAPHVRVVE